MNRGTGEWLTGRRRLLLRTAAVAETVYAAALWLAGGYLIWTARGSERPMQARGELAGALLFLTAAALAVAPAAAAVGHHRRGARHVALVAANTGVVLARLGIGPLTSMLSIPGPLRLWGVLLALLPIAQLVVLAACLALRPWQRVPSGDPPPVAERDS